MRPLCQARKQKVVNKKGAGRSEQPPVMAAHRASNCAFANRAGTPAIDPALLNPDAARGKPWMEHVTSSACSGPFLQAAPAPAQLQEPARDTQLLCRTCCWICHHQSFCGLTDSCSVTSSTLLFIGTSLSRSSQKSSKEMRGSCWPSALSMRC